MLDAYFSRTPCPFYPANSHPESPLAIPDRMLSPRTPSPAPATDSITLGEGPSSYSSARGSPSEIPDGDPRSHTPSFPDRPYYLGGWALKL
jgi:hypothetical protein